MMIARAGRFAVLVLLTLMFASGCGKAKDETGDERSPVVTGLKIETIATEMVPDQVEAVGAIRPKNSAQIAARITGTVSSMKVREGDRVNRGALLMTVTSAETSANAASAQAAVEQALQGVEEARSRKQLADVTFDRYQKLLQEEAVTRQEFDARLADKDVAARSLARAQAALVAAREGARGASSLAGYGRVLAPISGVVINRVADLGMTVFPGMQLMTIEGQDGSRLEVAAPESLLGKVKIRDRVPINLEGAPEYKYGLVEEVVPAVDRSTRTFTVKIAVSGAGLRSGSYGSARFALASRQGLLVPANAVVTQGALTSVWVVGNDAVVRMRIVKTGKQVGEKVEILAGLAPGEAIVTSGLEKVVEGARVAEKPGQR